MSVLSRKGEEKETTRKKVGKRKEAVSLWRKVQVGADDYEAGSFNRERESLKF